MDSCAATDPYAVTAPYYDLLAGSLWEQLGPVLADALRELGPSPGPIIDLGAGTGRSTLVVADAVPDAEVLAVEPSPSMRSLLLAHLALRRDLHARVTVLPTDIAGLTWPGTVSAVVACNMIGHLDADERAALWGQIATHLAPSGVALIGLQPPSRPERIEATVMTSVQVGRLAYDGVASAEPTGDRSMRWTMTYRTRDERAVVDETTNVSDWWTVSVDDVQGEAAAAGLTVTSLPSDLLALRHA